MKCFLVLFSLMFVCCAARLGNYPNLPEHEKLRYQNCYKTMQKAQGCSRGEENNSAMQVLIEDATCVDYNMSAKSYGDLPDELSRKQWLMSKGCPPSMVSPEKY